MSGSFFPTIRRAVVSSLPLLAAIACGSDAADQPAAAAAASPAQTTVVRDTMLPDLLLANGIAAPRQESQLASKLMGSVTAVAVREGARVTAGTLIATLDARDLAARREQVLAGIRGAEAMQTEAQAHAERIRGLYRDSAATPSQLDAAESGVARATAAAASARAGLGELQALSSYAEIRAPFAGVVTKRFVDPGAFISPGMPIATVQEVQTLRISVAVEPRVAQTLRIGQTLEARIEGAAAAATIEGIVPNAGALYTINALVDNRDGRFLAGSAALLVLPQAPRRMLLVPTRALVREGELIGVRLPTAEGVVLRWVRLGREVGTETEILSGVAAGEKVVLPSVAP